MPFTISHAAAVLPFRRTGLPLAALMIGSMSPDFAYFVLPRIDSFWTHSARGLWQFCWPVSLAVWWIYVRWLEAPTFALLPPRWRAAFTPSDANVGPREVAFVSMAIILGAGTHIAWDSFTHAGRTVVNAVPLLKAKLIVFAGSAVPVYSILQHLSTAIGLLVLGAWALQRWRHVAASPSAAPSTRGLPGAWRVAACALLLASTVALAAIGYVNHPGIAPERRLFYLAVGGMQGGALAWIAVALWVRFRLRK